MEVQVIAAYDDWEARIIGAGVAGAEFNPIQSFGEIIIELSKSS